MPEITAQEFDLVVVGGGPGGYPAAIRAAQLGLRTALVEKERPGGVCLNWGCIPTKAMLRSAEVLETMRHSTDYGILADNVRLDWPAVLERKERVTRTLTDGVAGLLRANGVTVVDGHARLVGPRAVEVVAVGEAPLGPGGPRYNAPPAPDGRPRARLEGRNLIVATGSTPVLLPIPGIDLPGVVTSDGAFLLGEVPKRVVVIGASAVGAEWATMFSAFGAEVTMVELLATLLPAEDEDMGKTLARSFARRGIKVQTGRTVSEIAPAGKGRRGKGRPAPLRVTITDPDGQRPTQVETDLVLVGVGRRPNTAGLDLERAGVATDQRGWVQVDDRLRTNVPGVHAIGDVTGTVLLAHVASHQGLVAAGVIAGHDERIDYRTVPAATFTHPEVASVGLTEARAREAGHDVVVGRFPFSALGRAQTYGSTEGLVKVVAGRRYREVLGVHIIGPGASDLIPEGVLAMHLKATLDDIAGTIHAHPTLGEGTAEAAMVALGLPVHTAPARPARTARGRGGRVVRADVEAAAATAAPAPPAAAVEAPHFHLTVAVDAEALLAFRAGLNRQLRARGDDLEVTLDDLVVKACAGLLGLDPDLNVSFAGDRLLRHRRVHVGIAVPGPGGPVVPVVRDADRKRLTQLAREARDLTGRARAGELAARELAGATFTVSNLGGLGVDRFLALIDPPQAAVLAVGAVQGELAVGDDGQPAVRRRMRLTLSIDHRALDGATGAGFLQQLKGALERPLQIVA
jgi:dihydrolipoamide dehydrogenase